MQDTWFASSSGASQPRSSILMGCWYLPSPNLANTVPDGWPRETRCPCDCANAATPERQGFRSRPTTAALLIEHWPKPFILLRDQSFRIHTLATTELEKLFPDGPKDRHRLH